MNHFFYFDIFYKVLLIILVYSVSFSLINYISDTTEPLIIQYSFVVISFLILTLASAKYILK